MSMHNLKSRYQKSGCCDNIPKSSKSAYKDLCRSHIQDQDIKYSNLPYYIGPRIVQSFGMSDEAESVQTVEFKGRQYIQSTGMSTCSIVDANYVAIAESERTDHDLDNPPPYCDSRLPNNYPSRFIGPTAFSYDRYYSGKTRFSLGAHVNKEGTLRSMFPEITNDKQTMKISFYIKDDGFENSFAGDKYIHFPFTTNASKYPVAYEESTRLSTIKWDTVEETQSLLSTRQDSIVWYYGRCESSYRRRPVWIFHANVQEDSQTILLDEIMLPDYTTADDGTPYTTLFRFKNPLAREMNLFVVPNQASVSGALNYRNVHMILG